MRFDRKIWMALMIALTAVVSCKRTAVSEESAENAIFSTTSAASAGIDLAQLAGAGKMPPELTVDIAFDHFFKTGKTYRAYSLKEVLAPLIRQLDIKMDSLSDAVVTFYCTDGYKPTQKLSELLEREGYIAFRDESVEDPEKNWPDSVQSKLAPYYLVWKNTPYDDHSLTWPYGLNQIRIDKTNTIYDPIYPKDDAVAIAGFGYFEQYCIKCHSVNKIGGNVGPELNYPKNITEYWEVENIWAFVKDPQSFRYNARMAPVTPLTRAEFDKIIAYLRYIAPVKPEIAPENGRTVRATK